MFIIKHWKPIVAVLMFPYFMLYTSEVMFDFLKLFGLIAALELGEIWFDTRPSTNSPE